MTEEEFQSLSLRHENGLPLGYLRLELRLGFYLHLGRLRSAEENSRERIFLAMTEDELALVGRRKRFSELECREVSSRLPGVSSDEVELAVKRYYLWQSDSGVQPMRARNDHE